jgi:hypothetical protein
METIHVILGIMILLAAGFEDQYRLVSLNRQIEVKWGREYVLDSGLSFAIEDLNDSRCHKDTRCFQTGEVVLWLKMKSSDTDKTDTSGSIKLSRTGTKTQTYRDYRFELIDVLPYRDTDIKYKKSDCKVLLKIKSIKQ